MNQEDLLKKIKLLEQKESELNNNIISINSNIEQSENSNLVTEERVNNLDENARENQKMQTVVI